MILVTIPLRTRSETNERGHWSVKAKRVKAQRNAVRLMLGKPHYDPVRQVPVRAKGMVPCVVTLTRIAPRALDGHDNLASSFKAIVDQVTEELGLASDRDPRVEWRYAQRNGRVREYAIAIRIEPQTKVAATQTMPPATADMRESWSLAHEGNP